MLYNRFFVQKGRIIKASIKSKQSESENLFKERGPEFVWLPSLQKKQPPVPRWQSVVDHNLKDCHNDNEQQEDCKNIEEDDDDDENNELAAFLCWQTVINHKLISTTQMLQQAEFKLAKPNFNWPTADQIVK